MSMGLEDMLYHVSVVGAFSRFTIFGLGAILGHSLADLPTQAAFYGFIVALFMGKLSPLAPAYAQGMPSVT